MTAEVCGGNGGIPKQSRCISGQNDGASRNDGGSRNDGCG